MNTLTDEKITEAERSIGHTLPKLYRKLLVEIGHGTFGQSQDCKWNTTKELHHPIEISDLCISFFEDPSALFNPHFPFGGNNDTQELWVIDSSTELVASIPHDTHPDDWPDEDWCDSAEWIKKNLEYT